MIVLDSNHPPLAIWFIGINDTTDFMGCLAPDPQDPKTLKFDYRFRYHKDDKVFDSADEKHWYQIVFSPKHLQNDNNESLVAHLRNMILMICDKIKSDGGDPRMTEMLYRNYPSFKAFMEAFQNQPWAFGKMVSEEEADKYLKN